MSAQPLSSPQLPALRAGLAGVSSCPCQPGPRPPWGTSLCRPQHHSLLSVLLSRTIMSPMWLCPHLRMVCTGGCNWVHSMRLWGGEHGWVLSCLSSCLSQWDRSSGLPQGPDVAMTQRRRRCWGILAAQGGRPCPSTGSVARELPHCRLRGQGGAGTLRLRGNARWGPELPERRAPQGAGGVSAASVPLPWHLLEAHVALLFFSGIYPQRSWQSSAPGATG